MNKEQQKRFYQHWFDNAFAIKIVKPDDVKQKDRDRKPN